MKFELEYNNAKKAHRVKTLREKMLDYINAHPGVKAPVIAKTMGMDRSTCNGRLFDMVTRGELRREKARYSYIAADGRPGSSTTWAYWALVAEPVFVTSTKQCREQFYAETRPSKKEVAPWITRNDNPDRKPIKDQGGQGTTGPRCGSSLDI